MEIRPQGSKMELLGVQNGARGLQNGAQGLQNGSKLVQNRSGWRFGGPQTPQESQVDPWEAAWEGPGKPKWRPMGPRGSQKPPKSFPKWFQNDVKISSKRGLDLECSKMSISDRCLDNFPSEHGTKFVQILEPRNLCLHRCL